MYCCVVLWQRVPAFSGQECLEEHSSITVCLRTERVDVLVDNFIYNALPVGWLACDTATKTDSSQTILYKSMS